MQLVLFNHLKEKPEDQEEIEPIFDVCTNYRYAERHDPAHKKLDSDKPATKTPKDTVSSTKVGFKKTATVASKLAKTVTSKGRDTKTEGGETETKLPSPEEEKKAKDLEAKRKRAENLSKSGFKPPLYSDDEKGKWSEKIAEYYAFFTDLINGT